MSRIAVIGIVGNSVFLPVEKFHEGGETVEAADIHFELGGKGFNQAVAAARFGADVSFIAAVGGDSIDAVRAFLDNEGIEVHLVKKDKATAFAAIITDPSGANRVTVYQGAQLDKADIAQFEECIKTADVLLLTNETDERVNAEAVRLAKESGVMVILNPAPSRPCCDYILDNVDLFTPNEHETEGLSEKDLVVTLGGRGCYIKKTNENIAAAKIGTAKDTTGAGDTFNGVLAAMLGDGAQVGTAASYANVAAGIGVTRKYAVSSIPKRDDIENEMRRIKNAKASG